MHMTIPWCGLFLNSTLNLSLALNKDLSPSCLHVVISFLILSFLTRGRYLDKNFSAKSFHVAMEFDSNELSQHLAISLREYGNSLNLKALSMTPRILKFLATSMYCHKWRWGSSVASPEYRSMAYNIWNIIILNLNWATMISSMIVFRSKTT